MLCADIRGRGSRRSMTAPAPSGAGTSDARPARLSALRLDAQLSVAVGAR